jgi:Tfp pilus assembly protein PilF
MNGFISRFVRFACVAVIGGAFFMGGCVGGERGKQQLLQDNARKQGLKFYKDGNYVDAAGSFKNAVNKDPRDYKSYYYLGLSYDAIKSYQQAIQAFRSALDNLKWTQEGRTDEALRAGILDSLARSIANSESPDIELEAHKTTAEDFFVIAKVHRYGGDADSALEAYKRAALLDPSHFHIQKDYGLYLEQLGQTKQAEPVIRKAYQLNPKDPQVADALRRMGIVPGPSLLDR